MFAFHPFDVRVLNIKATSNTCLRNRGADIPRPSFSNLNRSSLHDRDFFGHSCVGLLGNLLQQQRSCRGS